MKKTESEASAKSVTDYAKALGISPRKAWDMVHGREVAHFKIGRRVLIPASEIENTIKRNLVPAKDFDAISRAKSILES